MNNTIDKIILCQQDFTKQKHENFYVIDMEYFSVSYLSKCLYNCRRWVWHKSSDAITPSVKCIEAEAKRVLKKGLNAIGLEVVTAKRRKYIIYMISKGNKFRTLDMRNTS